MGLKNLKINKAGIYKTWFIKCLGIIYLVLVVGFSLALVFINNLVFNCENKSFKERVVFFCKCAEFETSKRSINNILDITDFFINEDSKNKFDGITVLDKDKKIIKKQNINEDFKNLDLSFYIKTLDAVNYINISNLGKVFIIFKEIKNKNGEVIGYASFFESVLPIQIKMIKILILSLLFLMIIFSLLFFISKYFIKSLLLPISEVSKMARRIALGDFKTRILKKDNDEFGELCDTINYMAQKLFESERVKNDFISSISHELRTPLTAIKGWAETIVVNENEENAKMNKKGLETIIHESARLCTIVEELLDFSKLQSGRVILKLEKMDILAELSEAVYMFRKRAKDENKILLYSEPETLPAVLGDKNRLKQVFINIIDNALKYVAEKGVVNVDAKLDQNFINITISDNGSGISKEDLPKVKTKFYKGNTQKQGSGIGLALANELILLHSGKLEIKSEENVGTVVSILVPVSSSV